MDGPLLLIKLNLTRVETEMETETIVIGAVIVTGEGIVAAAVVGVALVATVSNVESLVILLGSAPPVKGREEAAAAADMVEGMTDMVEVAVAAAAMALIVMAIGTVEVDEAETPAGTLAVVVDQAMISIVVTDPVHMSVHRVATVHDGCVTAITLWKYFLEYEMRYLNLLN